MKKISHHWQYNTHWHFMQWTNKINYLKLQKFCPTTCMVAGQINQNTLDHFTLMSEAAITTYTGQNSQDTKAIAHQDDAIFLPPSQWWSVDVMHSRSFSTQTTLLGGAGDGRNRPLHERSIKKHSLTFIRHRILVNLAKRVFAPFFLKCPKTFWPGYFTS